MNDDQMDELLRQGARDYNEPGPVPREAMWARIEQERSRRGRAAISGAARRAPASVWLWPGLGIAAVLLVAAGIVIGQRWERGARLDVPPVRAVARTAPAPGAATDSSTFEATPIEATDVPVRRASALAAAPRPNAGSERQPTPNGSSNLAYRLVVLQHLASTEAMITSFRTTARHGERDTLMISWSRDLLSTTRMLAASPVADDPVMKRLLQDLDFIIAEIVQYSAQGVNNPDELDLIEQSIDERSVIPKLRGTLPRRALSAGT